MPASPVEALDPGRTPANPNNAGFDFYVYGALPPQAAAGPLPAIGPTGIGADAALALFRDRVAPTAIPPDHPRFLAFIPGAPTVAAALADMATVEKALVRYGKQARAGGDKEAQRLVAVLEKCMAVLNQAKPVRSLDLYEEEKALLKPLCLITAKPAMYVANVREDGFADNPYLDAVRRHPDRLVGMAAANPWDGKQAVDGVRRDQKGRSRGQCQRTFRAQHFVEMQQVSKPAQLMLRRQSSGGGIVEESPSLKGFGTGDTLEDGATIVCALAHRGWRTLGAR